MKRALELLGLFVFLCVVAMLGFWSAGAVVRWLDGHVVGIDDPFAVFLGFALWVAQITGAAMAAFLVNIWRRGGLPAYAAAQPRPARPRPFRLRLAWVGWVTALLLYTLCFALWRQQAEPVTHWGLRLMMVGPALLTAWSSFHLRKRLVQFLTTTAATGGERMSPQAWSSALPGLCLGAWASSEAVAICGLALGFFTRNMIDFGTLTAASLALLYIHRPWTPPFSEALRRLGEP